MDKTRRFVSRLIRFHAIHIATGQVIRDVDAIESSSPLYSEVMAAVYQMLYCRETTHLDLEGYRIVKEGGAGEGGARRAWHMTDASAAA